MQRSRMGRELLELGFTLVLVLLGEVVVQLTGWHRLWVLLGALVVGHGIRAVVRSRRGSAARAQDQEAMSS